MELTANEIDRFWSHVVKGPRETDCWIWIWIGAVGDDGYGRFWVRTEPYSHQMQQRVLRPHRVAWALAAGLSIDHPPVVEHVVCDNPICVPASFANPRSPAMASAVRNIRGHNAAKKSA